MCVHVCVCVCVYIYIYIVSIFTSYSSFPNCLKNYFLHMLRGNPYRAHTLHSFVMYSCFLSSFFPWQLFIRGKKKSQIICHVKCPIFSFTLESFHLFCFLYFLQVTSTSLIFWFFFPLFSSGDKNTAEGRSVGFLLVHHIRGHPWSP